MPFVALAILVLLIKFLIASWLWIISIVAMLALVIVPVVVMAKFGGRDETPDERLRRIKREVRRITRDAIRSIKKLARR
jgi:membrane protein implicated in regulation of membrane protease activity